MASKLLNTIQASEMLGVTRQAISEWFRLGKFPNAFKVEGAIRIPVSDVEALKKRPKKTG